MSFLFKVWEYILWCLYTHHCLFILFIKDIWAFPTCSHYEQHCYENGCISLRVSFHFFWYIQNYYSWTTIAIWFWIFWRILILSTRGAALFYIPPNSAQGSQFLHILVKTCYFVVLDSRHETEVIIHTVPELHFLMISHVKHLLKYIQNIIVIKKKLFT